jgi:hypothetical protein
VCSSDLGSTGSLFPLFPWSAYILLGAAIGTVYVAVGQSTPFLLRKAIPVGLLLFVAGIGLERVSLLLYGQVYFWPTTPHLFITRIGFVTFVLGLTTLVGHFLPVSPQTIQSLAKESLLVYFVHVVLLYGSNWNFGIKQFIGGTMDFAHAYLLVIVLVTVMFMVAFYWNRTKKSYPLPSLVLRTTVVVAAVVAVA